MYAWKFSRLLVPVVLYLSACGPAADELSSPPSAAAPSATNSTSAAEDFTAFVEQVIAGPHETVTSADGHAELLIPSGALPAGTTAADISITPIDPALAPEAAGEPPPLLAYQLEPDGLQFLAPVLLQVTAASEDGSILELWLESGGEVSVLDPVSVQFDRASGRMTVSAALVHFSKLFGTPSYLDVEIEDPSSQVVGATFSVAVGVTGQVPSGPPAGGTPTEPGAPTQDPADIDLTPKDFVVSNGVWDSRGLRPAQVTNAPTRQESSGMIFYWEEDFTCPRAGGALVNFQAVVEYHSVFKKEGTLSVDISISSMVFACVNPTGTETPTATPTPTPTSDTPTLNLTPTPTPTPKEIGCAPGLGGLRQCLDEGLLAFSFPGEEPVHAVTDNSDPARVYGNPEIVAALSAPGVEFLHNVYYYPHETCALGKTCTLQTVLFLTGSETETRQVYDLLTQPSSQLEDRADYLLPNAQDWDASKCATGIRLSTQAGVPDQAVFFCTVTLDTVSYGFNLTAYGSLEPEFESDLEQGTDVFLDKVIDWFATY